MQYDKWDAAKFSELIRRFSLPDKKALKEFSKGMKMKAAIAVALSYDSRLLILDEPTSGLDPVVRDEMLQMIYDYNLCTFMLVGETENRAVEITAPICMQFFVLSVVLPMVFKFGVERGRVYMIVAVVALMAVLIAVFPLLEDMQEGGTIFIICACVFTVVAICVSFLASLKIYKSKEF